MNYPKNEEIARRYFWALILDYEYPAADNLPPLVVCRVLNDGYFLGRIHATRRQEGINKFNNGEIERS